MDVDIKVMPSLRVATVRHVGPFTKISAAFERLGQLAGPAGLFGRPGAAMVALYHDDPQKTPADRLTSDAGVIVSEQTALPPGLGEQRIPAGEYAATMHLGSYEQLGDAWVRFTGQWLSSSGRQLGRGPSYELYHNTPMDVPEAELRTELRIPLAPRDKS